VDKIRKQFPVTAEECAKKNKRVVVMVGDISHGIFSNFKKKFPKRYYNIGILEPTMISFAAGIAKSGLIPVAHTIAPFIIDRSFEQIKLDFCYHKLPGNIVSVGGTFDYSALGCTHHTYSDIAVLKTLQNIEIFYPTSPIEFDVLFKKNFANNKLSYFRIPKKDHSINFDMGDLKITNLLKLSKGKDLTVVCCGPIVETCKLVVDKLSKKIKIDLIYLNKIYPLNMNPIIESIKKNKKILIVQDHPQPGGLSDEILRNLILTKNNNFLAEVIALPDKFIDIYGSYEELCDHVGLSENNITKKIYKLFNNKKF
jgi:transketolase